MAEDPHRDRQPRHHRHSADRYWGPQTERARRLFQIGTERFPPGLIRAVGLQKQAAAEANLQLGELPREIAEPIIAAGARDRRGPPRRRVPAAGLADRLAARRPT